MSEGSSSSKDVTRRCAHPPAVVTYPGEFWPSRDQMIEDRNRVELAAAEGIPVALTGGARVEFPECSWCRKDHSHAG